MKPEPIPEHELDQSFREMVRTACLSLADVCYKRIMNDPEEGLRYLSELATRLDCKITVELKALPATEPPTTETAHG